MKILYNCARVVLPAFALFWGELASAVSLDELSVMALGPLDGQAVVKNADGKMSVLRTGDSIPGTNAVLRQVLTDKLVIEETIEREGQPAVKQTVWVFKAKAGAKSRVQRLNLDEPSPSRSLGSFIFGGDSN